MCLSIPYKIEKIENKKAIVNSFENKEKKIDLRLLKNIKIGDWILCLNNFAIQKIQAQEAQQIINLYNYDKNK